jgi:hypothetical protein
MLPDRQACRQDRMIHEAITDEIAAKMRYELGRMPMLGLFCIVAAIGAIRNGLKNLDQIMTTDHNGTPRPEVIAGVRFFFEQYKSFPTWMTDLTYAAAEEELKRRDWDIDHGTTAAFPGEPTQ